MPTRSNAPFWVVDMVALLLLGGALYLNKLGTDAFLVAVLAILGFGVSSRSTAHVPAIGNAPAEPSKLIIPPGAGGVAGLFFGVASMLGVR